MAMSESTEAWIESVEEHKETLETIAEGNYPLSDDFEQVLAEYEERQSKYE